MTQKPKLLLIAKLPPPNGGIAFITRSLINAGLTAEFELIHLNTSPKSTTEDIGKITLLDIFTAIINYFRLFRILIVERRLHVGFISGTSGTGMLRDFGYLVLLKIFRKRILYNLHGTRNQLKMPPLLQRLSRIPIRFSALLLSPTMIDRLAVEQLMGKSTRTKLFYNSTFIKNSYLQDRGQSEVNDQSLTIIGIGRISTQKGTFDLMHAGLELITEGMDLYIRWIGRGAYPADDQKLDDIINQYDDDNRPRVSILRDISDEQKYQELMHADIFVLPSYSENLPVSILEAMACELPVISTRVGAIPEIIREEDNGWLIDPGDTEKLMAHIKHLYTNRAEAKRAGQVNRKEFLEKYDSRKRIAELKSIFTTISA